jgi:hypothetical protein
LAATETNKEREWLAGHDLKEIAGSESEGEGKVHVTPRVSKE